MEIIGGIQSLKSDLILANGNGFWTFFLIVETIIEIRCNSIFEKYYCYGKLIRGRGNAFPASGNHFFSSFFRDSCKIFSIF